MPRIAWVAICGISEHLDDYSSRVVTRTMRKRAALRLIPAVPLAVAVLWLVWAASPPTVLPYLGFWFDFGVVPGVVLIALGLVLLATRRGLAPRNTLTTVGIAALGSILCLEALIFCMILTFPSF